MIRFLLTLVLLSMIFFTIILYSMIARSEVEAVGQTSVLINEISFKPSYTVTTGCDTQSWFEWVEIKNVSTVAIDLSGWKIFDNSTFADNLSGSLPVGGYAVIVAKEQCFRANFPSFAGTLISLNSYIGNGLSDSSDKVGLKNQNGDVVDLVDFTSGWPTGGGTISRNGQGSWFAIDPTPGAANPQPLPVPPLPSQPSQSQAQPPPPPQQQPQPSVSFSPVTSAVVGQEFLVSVTLSNFETGTYALKVLIGKDGQFLYGNTRGASGWLSQNSGWADFPTIAVSSGSVSASVVARTDASLAAGNYVIKIRAHKDSDNYDSEEKPLPVVVASSAVSPATSVKPADSSKGLAVKQGQDLEKNKPEEGKVLGGEAPKPKNEPFKLNFYLILSAFGLLVGSGGLVLLLRKGII